MHRVVGQKVECWVLRLRVVLEPNGHCGPCSTSVLALLTSLPLTKAPISPTDNRLGDDMM